MATRGVLQLAEVSAYGGRLTTPFCEFCQEAASVCLARHGHAQRTIVVVSGLDSLGFELLWKPASPAAMDSHADREVASEYGAYAVAILLIQTLTGMVVLQRSVKGTGVDFWLGMPDRQRTLDPNNPFYSAHARLEVSGLDKATPSQINTRLRLKIRQSMQSDHTGTDAYVIVVEFATPRAEVIKR